MMGLHAHLLQSTLAEIVVSDRRAVTRPMIIADAQSLARRLEQAGSARALVHSSEPVELLVAILACQEIGVDLVLAHASTTAQRVNEIAEALCVDTIVDSAVGGDLQPLALNGRPVTGASAIFLMTSGTTGQPKVVEYTFDRLVGRILPSSGHETNRNARWLLTYQPTAFAGLQVLLTACLTGGTIVEAAERTPAAFASAAEMHQCTHISGTPTFWRAFLMACDPSRMACLRQITLGGEAIDQITLDRLEIAFPACRITQIYASTEGGSLLAVSDGREGFPAAWLDQEVQGIRLRISDGVLEVRSPRSMVGLYSPAANAPGIEEGWLNTGDLVAREGDRVVFLGRRDAMINVGGVKVYPQQIESFLLRQSGVEEVRVKGVASPITGQAVLAEVVIASDLDEAETRSALLQACRTQLSRHQVPAVIRIVPAIAVAESGKKSFEFA